MTRGTKGCYIFCTDKETREYFKIKLGIENQLTGSIVNISRLGPLPADPSMLHPLKRIASGVVADDSQVLPFQRIDPENDQKYKTCVPLYTLQAAAGSFSETQLIEPDGWVIPGTTRKLRKGMFVAQVVGRSMEPVIPDGSYCLFSSPVTGTREGKIVLAQHHTIEDPETGGHYTVKQYRSKKVHDEYGNWKHTQIRLEPKNPAYKPIILTGIDEGELQIIAELVEVLS